MLAISRSEVPGWAMGTGSEAGFHGATVTACRPAELSAALGLPDGAVLCPWGVLALGWPLPGDAFEILVVDDGRTADTRATCDRYAEDSRRIGGPGIYYLRPWHTRGPAGARNRGWRE